MSRAHKIITLNSNTYLIISATKLKAKAVAPKNHSQADPAKPAHEQQPHRPPARPAPPGARTLGLPPCRVSKQLSLSPSTTKGMPLANTEGDPPMIPTTPAQCMGNLGLHPMCGVNGVLGLRAGRPLINTLL
jgi:hypothetical protein